MHCLVYPRLFTIQQAEGSEGRQGQTLGIRLRSGSNTELSTETRTVLPLDFSLLWSHFNCPHCLYRASASRVYLEANCLNFSLWCNNLQSTWKVVFFALWCLAKLQHSFSHVPSQPLAWLYMLKNKEEWSKIEGCLSSLAKALFY